MLSSSEICEWLCEELRLDHDGNQQMSIANVQNDDF